jgi:hypothetical protein
MKARDRIEEAARSRLDIGEPLLAGGFVWIAFPRAQVSTVFLARKAHLIGMTDRRLLIWARPHHARPAEDKDLLLDAPLGDVTMNGVRSFRPMLQVRLTTDSSRKLVLEFRPRDRRLGRRIVESLGRDREGTPPAPPATEVSATT